MRLRIFALLFLSLGVTAPVFCAGQPHLELRADPAHFSPNSDGFQDVLFLHPVLIPNVEVQRWRLDVLTARGKRIDRVSGPGLPALLKWDGFDKNNVIVPEGEYVVRLDVFGRGFRVSARQNVHVDVQPPVAGMTLSTSVYAKNLMNTDPLVFRPTVFDNSPTARWLIQVISETGRTVRVFSSTGSLREIEWDGSDPLSGIWAPPGNYHCAMTVWDQAGNESVPFMVGLKINVSTRELLERSLRYIHVNETESGLLVQLNQADLFRVSKGQLLWAPNAETLLKEVAILANAYPNAPVKLEGYAKLRRHVAKDQRLASVYAWRVYSHLVKQGHVTASRLAVRGRGRSAMFDRRAIPVPVLLNGVEVFLEGNDW